MRYKNYNILILSYQAVGANGVSIQTQNEISGTLLDIKA